jgi:hypothetical protein
MRHVVIASIDHANVDELHRSVLASFVCTPDPAQEKRAGAFVALADPSGWMRIGKRDDVLLLVRDGGKQTFMSLFYAAPPDQATLEHLVSGYQATLGDGDPRTVSAPGARGWMRTLRCAADQYVVALYIEAGSGAAERSTIDGVRCLRADEPQVAWPAAPDEMQQAIPSK